jgi:hypothetical protein
MTFTAAPHSKDPNGITMKARVSLCGIFLLVALPLGAGARLSMRVSPSLSFAPANLYVRAMIEADRANRGVEIVAESSDFYRASEIELAGDQAPRTAMFEFRSLPPGTYLVRATLLGHGRETRAWVQSQAIVVGGDKP